MINSFIPSQKKLTLVLMLALLITCFYRGNITDEFMTQRRNKVSRSEGAEPNSLSSVHLRLFVNNVLIKLFNFMRKCEQACL